jgi:transposase
VKNVDFDALPDDPAALKAAGRAIQKAALAVIEENDLLRERLERELRARYGQRSERSSLLGAPGQGLMPFLADALAAPGSASPSPSAAPPELPAPEPRAKHPGRRPIAESVERRSRVIDVAEEDKVCLCCKGPLRRIGEDRASRLEIEPPRFFIDEQIRPKYACPRCQDGVLSAEPPPAPIAKGLAGPSLLAHVAVSKFADHLPLHRQELIFKRSGIELPRSTLCDWVAETASILEPIWAALVREVISSAVAHADETKVPVQEDGARKTHASWIWTYLTGGERPAIVFDYTRTRSSEGPAKLLAGFRGWLTTDGYAGYGVCHDRGAKETGCWAHVRRNFVEARSSDPSRCDWMIAAIGRLYAVEREAHDMTAEARALLRRARAGPILAEIRIWLDEQAKSALPRSAIGEAIGYARNRWAALVSYLEDGRIEVDNNRAERALRQVVIGRKNWIFAGSDEGGRRAAIIYSVIATCKANDVEPWSYLRDVLERLPAYRGDIAALLPAAWKQARRPTVTAGDAR